jgi:hypothetical protein
LTDPSLSEPGSQDSDTESRPEGDLIQDDTIGVATAAWLAGDVGGAHDLVGGALRTSLTETLPGARRRGPLTLPSYQWNQAACLLMQLGNWTRASALIAAQFDLPRVVLEVEPAMPGERVWLEMGPESLKLTIRPESTTRLYWTVCLRLVEMLPLLVQTAKTASQAFGTRSLLHLPRRLQHRASGISSRPQRVVAAVESGVLAWRDHRRAALRLAIATAD